MYYLYNKRVGVGNDTTFLWKGPIVNSILIKTSLIMQMEQNRPCCISHLMVTGHQKKKKKRNTNKQTKKKQLHLQLGTRLETQHRPLWGTSSPALNVFPCVPEGEVLRQMQQTWGTEPVGSRFSGDSRGEHTANVSVGLTFGVMLKKNVIKYCCAQINNFCDFYFPVGRKCTKLLFRWKARRPRSREAHSAGHRARVWEGRAASSCWQGLLLSPL